MPRAESRPNFRAPEKKSGGGAVVAFMILLLLGGGGAGGYWYYFVGPGKGTLTGRPVSVAAIDTVATTDSLRADSAQADTTPPVAAPPAAAPGVPRPSTGTLVVRNAPVGARFRLNAEEPSASDSFTVEPGMHKVEISAAGYENYTESATVGPGEKIVLQATMIRRPAPPAGSRPPAAPPVTAQTRPQPQRQAPPARATPVVQPPGSPHCELPTTPGYNANNICFDTRPVLETPFVQVPEGVEGTPSASIIWVLVTAEGVGQRVVGVRPSSSPQFHIAAMSHARSVQYRPAEKDGKPVTAWAQFQFPPKR
jgi:hypothetical protein